MTEIKWNATKEDTLLIEKIADRAKPEDRLSFTMDIAACHLNGTPLDLQKLLDFDDPNFMHDIYGISRHMNRETGQLMNCFLPRCAK